MTIWNKQADSPVHVDRFAVEDLGGGLIGEASSMGLAPGVWPAYLEIDGVVFNAESKRVDRENELILVNYRASDGTLLQVYND